MKCEKQPKRWALPFAASELAGNRGIHEKLLFELQSSFFLFEPVYQYQIMFPFTGRDYRQSLVSRNCKTVYRDDVPNLDLMEPDGRTALFQLLVYRRGAVSRAAEKIVDRSSVGRPFQTLDPSSQGYRVKAPNASIPVGSGKENVRGLSNRFGICEC